MSNYEAHELLKHLALNKGVALIEASHIMQLVDEFQDLKTKLEVAVGALQELSEKDCGNAVSTTLARKAIKTIGEIE